MIYPIDILALSQPKFVQLQVRSMFCSGECANRRESFWRGWGFPQP